MTSTGSTGATVMSLAMMHVPAQFTASNTAQARTAGIMHLGWTIGPCVSPIQYVIRVIRHGDPTVARDGDRLRLDRGFDRCITDSEHARWRLGSDAEQSMQPGHCTEYRVASDVCCNWCVLHH